MHFGTSVFLADKSTKLNEVFYFLWSNETLMPNRMASNYHNLFKLNNKKLFEYFFSLNKKIHFSTKMEISNEHLTSNYQLLGQKMIMDCGNLENIRKFDGILSGAGSALANELASRGFDKNTQIKNIKKLILKLYKSYVFAYLSTCEEIENNQIQLAYIYNGRFLHERASWEACKSKKIEVKIFENIRNRYYLSEDGFHNRKLNQKKIILNWKNSKTNYSRKLDLAKNYFASFETKSNPFFTVQNNEFPGDMNKGDRYIVYFSNSDKEAFGFWETWNEPFGNQLVAVRKLVDVLKPIKYKLIIRLHPNLINDKKKYLLSWLNFSDTSNVLVVKPDDKVSSYALLRNAIGVVTYGSTLGIEAAWNLIPSAVLADCKYDELGIADKLHNSKEIKQWVFSLNKFSKLKLKQRKIGAAKWAYWVEESGIKIPLCTFKDKGWGAWDILDYRGIELPLESENKLIPKLNYLWRNFKFNYLLEVDKF